MTKDEMRSLLATLTPTAPVYRFNRVGNGRAKLPKPHEPVSGTPNGKVTPMFKPALPLRIDPNTKRPVRTFHPHDLPATPYYATVADNLSERDTVRSPELIPLFCSVCDCHGSDCTC